MLIDGTPSAEDLYLAASITARYGQGRDAEQVEVTIEYQDGSERLLQVKPMLEQDIPAKAWFI